MDVAMNAKAVVWVVERHMTISLDLERVSWLDLISKRTFARKRDALEQWRALTLTYVAQAHGVGIERALECFDQICWRRIVGPSLNREQRLSHTRRLLRLSEHAALLFGDHPQPHSLLDDQSLYRLEQRFSRLLAQTQSDWTVSVNTRRVWCDGLIAAYHRALRSICPPQILSA